ncbi:MAG: HupE/UreJ family protein [Gemmatimonadaceae bacterium]|nr:HupE/UreJ family protein [Gemmatimonadaceae bacterium]
MTEFATYAELGFRHIVGADAIDHILFLVALAAIYRVRDLRALVWVVTAFTVGHSITLALAVTGRLAISTPLIEFLIPVTIAITGVENLLVRDWNPSSWAARLRPAVAGLFGLIHGAGFANYLKALFVEEPTVPLLGFNVGIEAGQIVVLFGIALLFAAVDRAVTLLRSPTATWDTHRVRVVAVSVLVVVLGAYWAVQRYPA